MGVHDFHYISTAAHWLVWPAGARPTRDNPVQPPTRWWIAFCSTFSSLLLTFTTLQSPSTTACSSDTSSPSLLCSSTSMPHSSWAVTSAGAQVAAVAIREPRLVLSNFPWIAVLKGPPPGERELSEDLLFPHPSTGLVSSLFILFYVVVFLNIYINSVPPGLVQLSARGHNYSHGVPQVLFCVFLLDEVRKLRLFHRGTQHPRSYPQR